MDHLRDIQLIEHCGGGLSAEETARIDAHLADCQACAERYREVQQTWQALSEWDATPQTVDLAERVRERVTTDRMADAPPVYRLRHWVWPVTRIAAAVAVSIASGYAAGLALRPTPPAYTLTDEPDPLQAAAELYLDVLANESPAGLLNVIMPASAPEEGVS
jgi:anti-sigma factor RsiW